MHICMVCLYLLSLGCAASWSQSDMRIGEQEFICNASTPMTEQVPEVAWNVESECPAVD